MDAHIPIRIPTPIRSILHEWGSSCDPALIPIGNHDRQALAGLYQALGGDAGYALLPRRTILTMYVNAWMNSRFGLVAEVRREGTTMVAWLEGVMARDPVLAELLQEPGQECLAASGAA